MKTSEALYAAADYIRKHGWRQGFRSPSDQRKVCMGEAIQAAVGDAGYFGVTSFLQDRVLGEWDVSFNDEHCESANDAIAALEIAADIAAAEGR